MLDRPFIEEIIDIIEKKKPTCPIALTTNGSLLSDSWVDYFNTHNIKLGISFHGITGTKSIFEGMALSKNPTLIGSLFKLKNYVFKRVVMPFEAFAEDLCGLAELFDGSYLEISLDITQKHNINSIAHFENELRKIAELFPNLCSHITFNYTAKHCGYDQISILNDGSVQIGKCKKTPNDSWNGCNILYTILTKDEFDYFIDITDRFKKGLL